MKSNALHFKFSISLVFEAISIVVLWHWPEGHVVFFEKNISILNVERTNMGNGGNLF